MISISNRKTSIALATLTLMLAACSPQQAANMAHPSYWTNSDLAGPDVDHNGIRDDVDEWIEKQNFKPELKRAVQQYAKAKQVLMTTKPERTKAFTKLIWDDLDAMGCIDNSFNKTNFDDGIKIRSSISQIMKNTKDRILQMDKVGEAFSGGVYEDGINGELCK